jgi:spore germination cell wall hydrolase CwlJ-like protein/SH3-like domain-containing protein
MKRKMKPVIGCAVTVAAISMFSSMAVLAASDTEVDDAKWSFTAVANVTTQVNIRAAASTDSDIVGYLPKAGVAEVIERGEEWTHIISGGVEGYIKDEFLAYGDQAKMLAGVYGTSGVETSWDDVILFSSPDACSKVVDVVEGGSEYTLLDQEGAWYAIQVDDETIAYVPAEDVQKTTILDKAISVDTAYGESDGTYTAESWQEDYATSQTEAASAPEGYEGASEAYTSTEDSSASTDSTSTEEYSGETSSYTEEANVSDDSYTADDSESTASTEATVTTASSDDVSLLAALIYCEAGNQSREGKVAVGAVVMNRIASSSFPGSISSVIYQSGQFSPAISGWLDQVLASGAPSDCYEAAQAALNGENPVPGALYFNTSAGRGTKIGAHWFY